MDVINDQGYRQWLSIEQEYKVPEYVYNHEPTTKEAADSLPDALFADIVHRQFPVSSPADTWMSAAYFNENKHNIKSADLKGYVEQVIKRAAEQYGISKDVDDVLCRRSVEVLDPENDEGNYCLVMKDASGGTVSRDYPVFDAEGLKKACTYFARNRSSYPLETRTRIAIGLAKKAAQFNIDIPELISKEAMDAVPYRPFLMSELMERILLTKDAESATVIGSLVEMLNFASSDELIKSADDFVHTLDELDQLNGLDKHYGRLLLSPSEVVFSMTVKQAESAVRDNITLNKLTFSATKLAGVSPFVFREALGDDILAEISDNGKLSAEKLAAVIPTLPRPDRLILEQAIVSACA
jgi:hypothetical protein